MTDNNSIQLEIDNLKKQLVKKDKIINILRDRVKRSIQKSGDAYAIFERNIVLQEIVDQKTKILQSAIEEAQASNKAKSEFLANMSHELRTPLHAILSFSTFGKKDLSKGKSNDLEMYFDNIRTSGTNLLNLLNDLLDLSKFEAGKMTFDMEKSDILKVMNYIVTEYKALLEENELNINININNECATNCFMDSNKISQVIRNLFSNAIKFSSKGKNITVNVLETSLVLNDNGEDSESIAAIHITIVDQGVGIPENELEAVFDKFIQSSKTRTEAGGTGLGLAICKEIIIGHRGNIWAECNPEGGTIFNIVLPLEEVRKSEFIEKVA
jgi:signal transduction histidine kinase